MSPYSFVQYLSEILCQRSVRNGDSLYHITGAGRITFHCHIIKQSLKNINLCHYIID